MQIVPDFGTVRKNGKYREFAVLGHMRERVMGDIIRTPSEEGWSKRIITLTIAEDATPASKAGLYWGTMGS